MQDRLGLNDDEKKAIELKRLKHELLNGQERTLWNLTLKLAAKEFEFSEVEAARIRAALQAWESYAAGTDRRWLQPLVEALFPPDIRA